MARTLSRRGRMRSDDERCIQINSLFIEHEVEAKDLAPALYASQIIDSNDRDEILGGTTRRERTRRMIDILLLRGPDAFDVLLTALADTGYDHVVNRLRATEATLTPKGSSGDLQGLLREGTGASVSYDDQGKLTDRLKKIEDLWDILSRRVTRIEKRVDPQGPSQNSSGLEPLGEHELNDIKMELAELKSDTMHQVEELTSANTQKAALIEDLLGEVQEKTEQLKEAQNRIEELEMRIADLEIEKTKSLEVVESLREELDQHREHVKHQENWFNAENLRLKNRLLQQEKAIQQQESRVTGLLEEEQRMHERLEEQHNDLKEQRKFMEEQSQQLELLRHHMIQLAANSNIDNISSSKVDNTDETLDKTSTELESPPQRDNLDNTDASDAMKVNADNGNYKTSKSRSNTGITSHKANTTTNTITNNNAKDNTGSTKSNWVKTHRSTFNTYANAANNNQSHQPPTVSNVTAPSFSTPPTLNSTVCLNVPPTAHAPLSYRGAKRSAPAPLYRAYRKK